MPERRLPPRARRRATLGALLACALPVTGAPQEGAPQDDAPQEAEVRWYDVRAFAVAALPDPEPVDLRLHLSAAALDALEPDAYDVPLEEPAAVGGDGWSDLAWDCLGEEWPDEALHVEQRGGMLRVEGAPATHARLARVLAELEAHALATVELEAWRLSPAALAALPAALLDPAAAAAAAEAAGAAALRGALRPGRRSTLALSGFDAVLLDYDVEVAGSSRAFDPQVSVLRLGSELGAIVRECPDGRLYLRAWARHGERPEEPRTAALASAGGAALELPELRTALAAGSGLLADGGALALALGGEAGGGWLLRVRRGGAPPAAAFVPTGALCSAPLVLDPPQLDSAAPSGGWLARLEFLDLLDDGARQPLYAPLDLYEELRDAQERRGLSGALVALGDALYVPEEGALRALVGERVRALAAGSGGGTAALELRYGALAADAAAEFLARAAEGVDAAAAARLPHRALGACRVGDTLTLAAGVQRHYLADVDVEIAEASAVGDPQLALLFEGAGLWCMPAATRDGALMAWIDLTLHAPLRASRARAVPAWTAPERGDLDPRPPGRFALGEELELPATARAGLRGSHRLRPEAWTLLGATPLSGTDRVLLAVARGRLESGGGSAERSE